MVRFNDEYYREIIDQYGYSSLELAEIQFRLGEMSKDELATHWLCHFNGKEFAERFQENRGKCIVTTGFGLSGPPHMGTIAQIMKAIRLQQKGVAVQIVLGDLDEWKIDGLCLYARTGGSL